MVKYNQNWLDREMDRCLAKGWITPEAQQHIRSKYGMKSTGRRITSLPIYLIISVIGLAVLALALIWAAAYGWYHINVSIKLALAVIMLVFSQASVGMILLQERQGTPLSEGIGLIHCAIMFISLALVEQAFYIGWDIDSYILTGMLLILPAAYLLRSIGVIIWYYAASLCWAGVGETINVPGGMGLIWVLIALTIPFYVYLVREKNDFRLVVFSWIVTIVVFGAFGFSVRTAGYIPFLMLSTLAAVMLLTGYSIDIHKAWGIPFRWLGRLAAAGALIFSCMTSSWLKIVQGNEAHLLSDFITAALFIFMIVIYVKWLKKRFWAATVYSLIPILLAVESLFVHNGLQPSTAIVISAVALILLGIFEIGHGFQHNNSQHIKWGLLLFFALVTVLLSDYQISPVVPLIGILVFGFLAWKSTQILRRHNIAAIQKARKAKRQAQQHTGTSVHAADRPNVPPVPPAAKKSEGMPSWMDDQSITAPAPTVVKKPVRESLFVPPVFHEPDEMPIVQANKVHTPKTTNKPTRDAGHITSSPWSDLPERPKREKHFTKSPWATEGDDKQ